MKIKDVRLDLSEAVAPYMQKHGFSDNNHDCNFTRKAEDCVFIFKLQVYAKTGWFFTKPLVCVGYSNINKLYNQIIQPKDRLPVNGHTFCFGISNKHQGRGDYNIENIEDISAASVKIMSDFSEIALPYYENNKNIELAEKSLNQRMPDGTFVSTTVSASCKGLIAAHLCGRADFKELADFYISTAQRKEFATPILKVKEHCLNLG